MKPLGMEGVPHPLLGYQNPARVLSLHLSTKVELLCPATLKLKSKGLKNQTDQNTVLLTREYLLNSLYILNESYVRVNMFRALKIGLDIFLGRS